MNMKQHRAQNTFLRYAVVYWIFIVWLSLELERKALTPICSGLGSNAFAWFRKNSENFSFRSLLKFMSCIASLVDFCFQKPNSCGDSIFKSFRYTGYLGNRLFISRFSILNKALKIARDSSKLLSYQVHFWR